MNPSPTPEDTGIGSLLGTLRRGIRSRFAKDAGVLAGGQLLASVAAFVQGLVVARVLGPEQYGVALLIISVPTMMFSLLDARTSAAAVKYITEFDSAGAPGRVRAMTRLGYSVDLGIAFLTLGLVALVSSWAAAKVVHAHEYAALIVIYSTALIPKSFSGTSQSVLGVCGRFQAMAVVQLVAKAVGVVAVLGLVLTGWGIEGVIYGRMAELVVTGVALLVVASGAVRKTWGASWVSAPFHALRGKLREIFRFLAFTELTELVNVASKQADMNILGYFAGPTEAGFYGLAKRMTGVVGMVVAPLESVLYPRLAKAWAEGDAADLRRILKKYVLGMSVPLGAAVLLAIPLCWPFIHYVVGMEFDPAVPAAQLMFGLMATWVATSWQRPLFHAMGAVRYLLLAATVTNVLSVIGFCLLAGSSGATGVSATRFVIGGLFFQILGLFYARKRLREPHPMDGVVAAKATGDMGDAR
ncbi:MAG: oligosaccharide flippase family protein [Candidatus Eisenbacteria bacterium]